MDTVEIKLPISGKTVILRNYTTRADDEKAEYVLYLGVLAEEKANDRSIRFPLSNVMASQNTYIPRLVQSIDGDSSNLKIALDELRSEDYQAVAEAVEAIVEAHSPKVKEARNASTNSTKES